MGLARDRTMLLDLDGTLVDTLPDLAAMLNRLAARQGVTGYGEREVAAMIGDGVRVLVERACAARGIACTPDLVAACATDYAANAAVASRPYPGVEATLAALREAGWRLAVCTNKPLAATRALLAALGLDGLFAAIGAGDSFPVRKPDPGHLLLTLAAAGGEAGSCVMVGDHRNDVSASVAAGLPVIFAAWGYGGAGMAAGATAVAGRFADLPAIAAALPGTTRTGGGPSLRESGGA